MTGRKILVAGGSGRLGSEILRQLGDRGVSAARRAPAGSDVVRLDKCGLAEPSRWSGIAAAINCVGLVHGQARELQTANVEFAFELARQAREGGIGTFVQVSSFSVWGAAEFIDASSPVAPDSDYGRSKAEAEERVLALASAQFRPVAVRLPFMFSATHPGLIATMIKGVETLRIFPVRSKGQTLRSMLTYAGAAQALIQIANADRQSCSILAAADPAPLDLKSFIAAIGQVAGKRILPLPLPAPAETLLARLAPGLVRRIMRSSVLAAELNCLADDPPGSVLREINQILGQARAARDA
jgi:nucleoside-diphosphate-sugar epimerase